MEKNLAKGGEEAETIVGPSVKVEGDFISEGNIKIEGQVNGSIKTAKQLRVEEGAKVNANISADNSVISGEIRGNMKLATTLELTPTAKVYGDVATKTLIVAAGAILHGHVIMDDNEKGRTKAGKKGEGYEETNNPSS